ncbi:uncharacterized protein LOC133204758 [Saccostrea echinata]|uniref:uncharacterized protein LOC133204758 n=1 Tax=Saccostrea echinata TaxID=191078 RepID=UPI002A8209E7|nr:uncharacterized protein LOC133204758 [Saccostrea echinata]
MIARETFLVVFFFLIFNILKEGHCEMTASEVHEEVLELRQLISKLSKTVHSQNNRITFLQNAFRKQRMDCQRTLYTQETKVFDSSVVVSDNLVPTQENVLSPSNLNTVQGIKTNENRPIVESAKPIAARPSVIRKERLLIPITQPPHPTAHRTIAFYAYFSSDVSHTGQGQILKFDVVKTNAGNAYHKSSGVFIAPESGYYAFSWTSRIKHYGGTGEDHALELVVNSDIYGSIYMKSLTGEDGQATGVAIAHVNQGDDVYIQTHSRDPGSGAIRSDLYGRSSFSGWKLY